MVGQVLTETDAARLAKLDKIEARDKAYAAKQAIIFIKARKAGITATDAEVKAYLAEKAMGKKGTGKK